ncbi:MAG: TolC family protein [Sphingomonas bacterium]|nr:TolC family protein [Sphingomonas bacterium]
MRKLVACAFAAILTGCATYSQSPLDAESMVLSPPVAAVLAKDTAAIQRPYLTPIAVDLSKPLDLNAVALIAVATNPDLKAQRARAGITDAQIFDARLLPDPTFSFGLDKILSGPDPFSNLMSTIGQELNALRTRRVRVEGARAASRQVRLDLAWAEWQTAGQARLQAIRIDALGDVLAISRVRRAAAQDLLDRMLRAAGRGDLMADQVQAARIAALDAAERLRTAEKDEAAARFELTRLLGLPPESILTLADALPPPGPLSSEQLFHVARSQRLDLQALQAGYQSQEAAVHQAVLLQFPTLNLAVTGTRDTGGNKLLGGGVDFTLPLWNRNRGGIAIARATRAALKAEFEARLFQTRAEIGAAVAGISLARRQRAELEISIPALRRFGAATARAARRGDLSSATAQTAADALRDKELLLVQVNQSIAEQTVALELLTGVPQQDWAP